LSKAAEKRALFVGETIIDVYHYVRPLGRPLKESIVSVEHISTESFQGGVMAAAAHARGFCKSVDVYSNGPSVAKERWVEAAHVRKLFEVYNTQQITKHKAPFPTLNHDVVVVCDYGHGMMSRSIIEQTSGSKYLAVNVQTNSGNFGFNLATKYLSHRVDYLVVDEPEARLATHNQYGPISQSLQWLQENIAEKVVVTLGKKGAIGADDTYTCEDPALTDKVTDTLGAGDAFFAITALIAEQASMPEILRIGNAAGACKTGIVGHQRAVGKDELVRMLS